jgi:hypothetical protein
MQKTNCPVCNVIISPKQLTNHVNSNTCLQNKKRVEQQKPIIKLDDAWQNSNGKYTCPHCNLEYTKNGIATHIWRTHGDGKNFTANNDGYKNGTKIAWNKGLTKLTSEKVKQIGETLSNKIKNGEIIPSFLGRKHKAESKFKIQQYALSRENPCGKKIYEYITVDGAKIKLHSSWEVTIAKNLDEYGIKWIRPEPLKWIDCEGKTHNYYSDFYIPEWDVYLEPKSDWIQKIQNKRQPGKWEYLNMMYNNIFILKEHQLDIVSIKLVVGIK